jgi:uncharacterized protein HemY
MKTNQNPGDKKLTSINSFDILMVLALGALAGAGTGLAIGSVVKKYKNPPSIMSSHEMVLNLTLVVIFSCISIAILCWFSLL